MKRTWSRTALFSCLDLHGTTSERLCLFGADGPNNDGMTIQRAKL